MNSAWNGARIALDSTRVCIILSGPTYSDSFWKPSILLAPLFPLFLSLEIRLRIIHNVHPIRRVCRSNYRELNHPKNQRFFNSKQNWKILSVKNNITRKIIFVFFASCHTENYSSFILLSSVRNFWVAFLHTCHNNFDNFIIKSFSDYKKKRIIFIFFASCHMEHKLFKFYFIIISQEIFEFQAKLENPFHQK